MALQEIQHQKNQQREEKLDDIRVMEYVKEKEVGGVDGMVACFESIVIDSDNQLHTL